MRRPLAAVLVALLLASCTGRAAISSGVVIMAAGGIGVATGSPTEPSRDDDRSGGDCEGAHGYCTTFGFPDLSYNGPTPGIGTLLFGAALVIFGFATLKQEDEKIAAERAAAGIVDPPPAPPVTPEPPPPPPPRWTVDGSTRESGAWREVPEVPGDEDP